jgi:hypothetical protein
MKNKESRRNEWGMRRNLERRDLLSRNRDRAEVVTPL